jgi:integrase
MPRFSCQLIATERGVRSAKANGRRREYRVKGHRNLVFRVTEHGTKSWLFIYRSPATGRWAKKTLGSYPTLDLAAAKKAALELAVSIHSGHDPSRQQFAEQTFAELAKAYIDEHGRKHARDGRKATWTTEVQRMLNATILPTLGSLKAEVITKADVARVVETVASRGSFVAADRVLGVVRSIYGWAAATGRMDADPTRGLKKRNHCKPRERTLTDDELRALWQALNDPENLTPQIRDALRLQLLLALRIGEAVGAAKTEIDLEKRLWTIPAHRTKSQREHRLPLSQMAVDILSDAIDRSGSSPWLFPSPEDEGPIRPKSGSRALLRLRRRIGIGNLGTHDLRRSCATRLGDFGTPDEVVERILNHAPTGVSRKHYNHSRHTEAMREALENWAEELQRIVTDQPGPAGFDSTLHVS